MTKDFGIVCSVTVHLISDDENETEANVAFECGVNQVPTRQQLEGYRVQAIQAVSDATGLKSWRLSTLEDRGFAEPLNLRWTAE